MFKPYYGRRLEARLAVVYHRQLPANPALAFGTTVRDALNALAAGSAPLNFRADIEVLLRSSIRPSCRHPVGLVLH